jgi:negative regulator of flagellin synthesis FlgM
MTTPIKPGLQPQQPPVQLRTQSQAAGASAKADGAASVRPTDDSVKLTDSAKALDAASRADGINTKRVEELRAKIADGSYKPDAQAIASKFLAMEAQMGGNA